MKVTFLLPNMNLRGGIRAVVDYSDLLCELGADVTVVFPTRLWRLPMLLNEVEWLWRAPQKLLFGRWFRTRARVLAVPSLDHRYIPRADVLVATAWQTAEWAASYPPDRGRRHYFIQDVETYEDGDRAARTYRLDFLRTVTTPWLKEQLAARFGATVHSVVPYGLDLDLYRPADRPIHPVVSIGTLYDKSRRKGFDIALAVCEKLQAARTPFVLRPFGSPRRAPRLPAFARPEWRVPPGDTARFYRSCDIWLCASRSDGFYMPGLEALACGCGLVTTRVGGTVYYAVPERTALVADPGDVDGLFAALRRMIAEPGLRIALGAEGARYVQRHDRRQAARNMLRALSGEAVFVEPDPGLVATHAE